MNETAAVTGGTGFIGRYLIDLLLADGFGVRVLTRNPERAKTIWDDRVQIWPGDVTDPNSLVGFAGGTSIIFNLAGTIFEDDSLTAVNENGTLNLLKECMTHPLQRFVHLSSVGVIGSSQHKIIDEETVCNPVNAYERSKLRGEELVMEFFHAHGLPVTVMRPTIVFGIGRSREKDSFASWMQTIQSGRFRYIGRGDYSANYIYAEDVAAACVQVSRSDQALGEIFIVADPCPLREFVQAAAEFMGAAQPATLPLWIAQAAASASSILEKSMKKSLPLTASRVQALTSDTIYSAQKLQKNVGFVPAVGYREGLSRTIHWYKAQGIVAN